MRQFNVVIAAIFMAMFSSFALATTPTPDEIKDSSRWAAKHLDPAGRSLPFSFVYDGKSSVDLLAIWPKRIDQKQLDKDRTQHTFTWTDPKSGLEVRCVAVVYSDFPAVEWTAYFRNTGNANTPILENIEGLDFQIKAEKDADFTLHYHRGDYDFAESFQPFEQTLFPNTTQIFSPAGGRPTSAAFPYFNLQQPGGGMILAVGWPGQWATAFQRQADRGLRIRAGQEVTQLYLKPGEEVRSPLIALLFWQGKDSLRAQNLWRRWMLAHNLPRPGGKLPSPFYPFCDGAWFPGMKTSETGEKQFIDILAREKVKVDYWWVDAGWYPCDKGWWEVGTWEPDPVRFPNGVRAVSDYVHARGMKMVLWFEPERVFKGSWLAEKHPEWLLGGTGERQLLDLENPEALAWFKSHWFEPEGMFKEWQAQKHPEWLVGGSGDTQLLNLGNPAARAWVMNHFDKLITEQAVDVYRQDFNMDPLEYWRNNDAPDRQGITENLHVQGYLAYWDELRRRHPGMLIDSCASGGRRLDLETMRRAVPLLRSDYQPFDGNPDAAVGNQGHTYGLSSWIPYYGTGVYYIPKGLVYTARSYLTPAWGVAVDARKPDINWDLYRRLADQWRQVADRMLGDYYPLTPYNLQKDLWMAWQFDRPEQGDGMIQAFRHETSDETNIRVYPHGLDPAARYAVVDMDGGTSAIVPGSELLEQGLRVEIKDKPGAAILTYNKVR